MQFNDEAAVIGSILIDASCISEVDKVGLIADDFKNDVYRAMFEIRIGILLSMTFLSTQSQPSTLRCIVRA